MTIDYLTMESVAQDMIAMQRRQKQPPAPGGFVVVETISCRDGIARGFPSLTAYRDYQAAGRARAADERAASTTSLEVSYAVHPVTAKLYAEILRYGPDFPIPRYIDICQHIAARPDQYRLLGGIATPEELKAALNARAAKSGKTPPAPAA